ncbi:MAG: Gfo/Idh/MocA family oxidoreductase [Candidatus Methanomethylicaceae archaeon]
MSEKNVAVIGAGYWGKNLVRNFYNLGVLKAVCDISPSIREEIAKTYNITVTDNLDSILNDPEITAVVISSPAAMHYELTKKSLLEDKHVFVEKPLALTYKEGKELVDLAREKQKTLFVGHILQYHPAVMRLKELINRGTIGRIQYIYSRRLSLGKIRREENILWSFAPHDISIILSLTGEEPYYIDAVGSNFLHARIADVTVTHLKFPSGIGAHIFVNWLNPFKEQKLVVVGSDGMLVFDDTEPVERKLIHYPHSINWLNGIPVPQKAEAIPIDITDIWEEPLRAECKAFLNAIDNGTQPITSGEEGLRVLKILEICQHSIEQKERFPNVEHRTLNLEPRTLNVEHRTLNLEPRTLNVEHRTLNLEPEVFIHPTAVIDDGCEIGAGTKIWHFSHVMPGAKIGKNCNIGQNVTIERDVVIGNNCKIQNNVSVYKGVTLEDGVFCGPSMVFTNVYNPRAEIRKMDQLRPTLVKRGATLGANCTIVCGVTIGRYAFVGAGAVVTKDVPDHALVVGNPARQIGWVCECGERLNDNLQCPVCNKKYSKTSQGLSLISVY